MITTGASVGWAFRGFNPHHRKEPSYYAILAHLAQTGHIVRVKNRPGNVHDSKGAVGSLRDLIDDLTIRLGRALPLEFRGVNEIVRGILVVSAAVTFLAGIRFAFRIVKKPADE